MSTGPLAADAIVDTAPRPASTAVDRLRVLPAALDPRVVVSAVALELVTIDDPRSGPDLRFLRDQRGRPWRLVPATPHEHDPDLQPCLAAWLDVPAATVDWNGQPWWLLREPAGVNLADRIGQLRQSLDPATALEWLEPIARTIGEIHAAGYVCLRLHPWTVRYADPETVWLVDVPGAYSRATPLRRTPVFAGYSAPELYQQHGAAPPSPEADLFALGALLWLLLAGRSVPISQTDGFIPAARIRDLVPSLPVDVARIVDDCLAPDPAQRPRSAQALVAALRAAVDRSLAARANPDPLLRCAAAVETHVGILKRRITPTNQDAVLMRRSPDGSRTLLVVADGVSTARYGSGDAASGILCAALQRWADQALEHDDDDDLTFGLVDAIQRANHDIIDVINRAHAPFQREPVDVMGSTCIAALCAGGKLTLAWAGDSRAYLLRDGRIDRLTRDHNLATLAIVDGTPPDHARAQPHAEALARCMGTYELGSDGQLVASPVEIDVVCFPLQAGDRLLLCTDGATDFIGDTEAETETLLRAILTDAEVADLAAIEICAEANRRGGGDNIGVAVAFIDREPLDVLRWAGWDPPEAD